VTPPCPSVPETVDVLVIGGGINGISTFRELALQGVDVVLLERGDFCSGASAALSRMVHGGLRYLENGEFRLVRQSLDERDRLLRTAPHCVSPLPTVVPIAARVRGTLPTIARFFGARTRPRQRPALMIRAGLTLYDLLSARSRSMPRHRRLSRSELHRMVPGITPEAVGGVLYFDARVTHPERLGVEMILDTEAETGRRAFSYTEITGGEGEGLTWRDSLTGTTGSITPRVVVNATGAWVDLVEAAIHPEGQRARVQGTKGSHLMIRNPELAAALADRMVYYENADGRICITFNHAGATMVGSTDIRVDDPDTAMCLPEEKAYMLAALRHVFPAIEVTDEQIVHVFTGVRPLPVSPAGATGRISRDHSVDVQPAGSRPYAVLTLIGGKWTTFRAFGEEVADLALAQLGRERTVDTKDLAIGGGRDYPASPAAHGEWLRRGAKDAGLTPDRFAALAARYGTRASQVARYMARGEDAPLAAAPDYSRRELLFLVESEKVREIGDLLLRRTTLGIEGRITQTLIDETAGLMGSALGWDAETTGAAVERMSATLAKRHRVRADASTKGNSHVSDQEGPPEPAHAKRAVP
jgi:glycerol-3-phosphate dehydrogenase